MLQRNAHDERAVGMEDKPVGKPSHCSQAPHLSIFRAHQQLTAEIICVVRAKCLPVLRIGENDLAFG
jgi:hypothetical protein